MEYNGYGNCKICGNKTYLNENGICFDCVNGKEKPVNHRSTGICRFCGETAPLNSDGTCEKCLTKFSKGKIPIEEEQMLDPSESCIISDHKIIRAFNRFYKFFHHGSIAVSIILYVGWFIYLPLGMANNAVQRQTEAQAYLNGSVQVLPAFDPCWGVPISATLILILGLFLSYISAAIASQMSKVH